MSDGHTHTLFRILTPFQRSRRLWPDGGSAAPSPSHTRKRREWWTLSPGQALAAGVWRGRQLRPWSQPVPFFSPPFLPGTPLAQARRSHRHAVEFPQWCPPTHTPGGGGGGEQAQAGVGGNSPPPPPGPESSDLPAPPAGCPQGLGGGQRRCVGGRGRGHEEEMGGGWGPRVPPLRPDPLPLSPAFLPLTRPTSGCPPWEDRFLPCQ